MKDKRDAKKGVEAMKKALDEVAKKHDNLIALVATVETGGEKGTLSSSLTNVTPMDVLQTVINVGRADKHWRRAIIMAAKYLESFPEDREDTDDDDMEDSMFSGLGGAIAKMLKGAKKGDFPMAGAIKIDKKTGEAKVLGLDDEELKCDMDELLALVGGKKKTPVKTPVAKVAKKEEPAPKKKVSLKSLLSPKKKK